MADRKLKSLPGNQNPEDFDISPETDSKTGLRIPPRLQPEDEMTAQNQLNIQRQNMSFLHNPDLENLAKGDISSDDITTISKTGKDEATENSLDDQNKISVQQELNRLRERQIEKLASLGKEKETDDVSGILLSGSMRVLRKIPGVGFLLSMFEGSSDLNQKISTLEKLILVLKLAKPAAAIFDLERAVIMWTVPLFIPTIGIILLISIPAALLAIPFGVVLQEYGPCPTAKAIAKVVNQLSRTLEGLKRKIEEQEAKKSLIYNLKEIQLNAANGPMSESPAQKAA